MYIEKGKNLLTEFYISFFIFLIKRILLQPLPLKVFEKYLLLLTFSTSCHKIYLFIYLFIYIFSYFAVLESHVNHFPWGLPESKGKETDETIILTQKHYVTGYQTSLRLPSWVGYKLTKKVLLWIFHEGESYRSISWTGIR